MKKAIYFFQYLPPWKIDVFNEIAMHFDLTVAFFDIEREGFTYDRKDLFGRLRAVKVEVLSKGFSIKNHPVRFGVAKLIRKVDPDIVFVHEFSSVTAELLLLRKFYGYRLCLTTSDNLIMAQSSQGLVHRVRNWVFRHVDSAIFYSEPVRRYYQERFPALKTAVCPNIQKPETLLRYRGSFPETEQRFRKMYHLDPEDHIILYAGRLVEVKGLDLLLPAFAKCMKQDFRLVLVGDGACKDALQRQVSELGIADHVIFAGFAFGAELYCWYDMADFFVLPSRYEPFGAVVNEALVFGCPVVVSRYIGALDFVTDKNGIIFDPLDPDDFQRAFQCAFSRFHSAGVRKNLMPLSFEDYVSAYIDIDG